MFRTNPDQTHATLTQRLIAQSLIALQVVLPVLPALNAGSAWAQATLPINPDRSASGQRPVVNAGSNGVPIVQIAPPSGAGVSHNRFTDYNVGSSGVILNNSGANSQTQLGGWISGNPMLGNNSARTILNEVTGRTSSRLNGYTEVAGNRANVIVANPNGISCNGCGFINVPRATLTTGTPQFGPDGSVSGFNVQRGQISIDGQGLNARNTDQLDLIAHSLRVNAEIWANKLEAVAGANQVDYGNNQATRQAGTDAPPAVAIDVSQLGSMYANSIRMVGTENGVGVNSAGTVAALTGDLQVTSAGDVRIISGQVQAKGNIAIQSGQHINNAGTVYAEGNTVINANGNLQNTNLIAAAGNVQGQGGSLDNSGIIGAGVNGQAQITLAGSATLTTNGNLRNQGQIVAGDGISIDTQSQAVDNTGGTIAAHGAMQVQSGRLINAGGLLQANDTMSIDTHGQTLSNTQSGANGGIIGQNSVTLNSGKLDNQAGFIGAKGAMTVTATQTDNTQSGSIVGQSALTINGNGINNSGGQLQAQGDTTLNLGSGTIDNSGSLIRSGSTLSINAGTISNANTSGANQGIEGARVNLAAATLDNTEGAVRAGDQLSIASTGTMNNKQGLVSSTDSVEINAASITNTQGTLIATRNLKLTATNLSGDGKLLSSGDMVIGLTGNFHNADQIQANNNLDLTSQGTVTNNGLIRAGNTLNFSTADLNNQAAGEISATNTNVTVSNTFSNQGLVDGTATRISAGAVNNTGRIYGDHVAVQAETLLNDTTGVMASRGNMDLGVGNLVNREHAIIYSAGNLSVGGTLNAQNQATGSANSIVNASATIESAGDMALSANSLVNRNDHFSSSTQTLSVEQVTEYQPSGWTSRLPASSVGMSDWDKGRLVLDGSRYPLAVFGASPFKGTVNTTGNPDNGYVTTLTYHPHTDPIWALFGVAPPAPRPPLPASTCEGDHPPSGCDAAYAAINAWTTAALPIYEQLDRAIGAFNRDLHSRSIEDWYAYNYTSTTTQSVVHSSDPAMIVAGRNLTLSGAITNDKSQIIAGGAINGSAASINNIDAQGYRTVTDNGTVQFTELVSCGTFNSSRCREWRAPGAYNPGAQVTTVGLPIARIQQNTSAPSGIAVPTANMTTVGQTAAGASHALTGVGNGQDIGSIIAAGGSATVPGNGLFKTHPEPGYRYLIETDPRFADYRNWLSSDYMLQQLNRDPATTLKRLGDGFYEQKLVADQIMLATGQRFIGNYTNNEDAYRALMQAGVTFGNTYQLNIGTALTEEQMKLLTTDIVWLVQETVTLADGSQQTVLVPKVYVRVKEGDLRGDGTLIAGNDIHLNIAGDLTNSGTIGSRGITELTADNINNVGGRIQGNTVALAAQTDLNNLSGSISGDSVALKAGRDINIRTNTIDSIGQSGTRSGADRIATVYGGDIALQTGRDLSIAGAQVSATGDILLTANRNATINTVETTNNLNLATSGYIREKTVQNVGSQIDAGGNLTIASGLNQDGDLLVRGSQLTAGEDLFASGTNVTVQSAVDRRDVDLYTALKRGSNAVVEHAEGAVAGQLDAGRDVTIVAVGNNGSDGKALAGTGNLTLQGAQVGSASGVITLTANNNVDLVEQQLNQSRHTESVYRRSGLVSKTSRDQVDDVRSTQSIGSSVSGDSVRIAAGNDLTARGAGIVGTDDVTLLAKNDITITTAQDTSTSNHSFREKTSGLFSSGGASITLGKREIDQDKTSQSVTNIGSSVGSLEGNVTIAAGQQYTQTGSQVLALQGDIDISARKVDINAAIDSHAYAQHDRSKQSGLTLAVSNPVISAVQTIDQTSRAASNTSDPRMKALAAATAGLAAKNAYDAVKADPENLGGINLSISIGSSKSQSSTAQNSSTAAGSTVAAGGNINIVASGAGKESDITIQSSTVKAGNDATLKADDAIHLLAAQNTDEQHSTNTSSSGSIGVSIGTSGFGVTASASKGRGNADGSDVTWTNTHVGAGNELVLESGGDTTLKGAVASGKQVVVNVGGDLNIESLQDTSSYDSKQSSIGGSLTIGAGVSGSVNFSKSNINSDYASVTEQSGIKAGDDGFQVNVKGNTDLKGAVIASTDKAVQDGKNQLDTATFTQSDIHNHADYKGQSVGLGIGYSTSGQGVGKDQQGRAQTGGSQTPGTTLPSLNGFSATPPVAVSASDDASSTTHSGISGASISITDEAKQKELTGKDAATTVASINRDVSTDRDTANALKPIFNEQEIKAGFEIVGALTREVGTFLDNRAKEADAKNRQIEEQKKELDRADLTPEQLAEERYELYKLEKDAAELAAWAPGGDYYRALSLLTAAASGNVTGGAGQLAQAAAVGYLQSLGAEQIKKFAQDANIKEGSPAHAAIHALAGCMGAAGVGQSCAAGASGAAAGALLNGLLNDIDPDLTNEQKISRKNLVTSLVAAVSGEQATAATRGATLETINNADGMMCAINPSLPMCGGFMALSTDPKEQKLLLSAAIGGLPLVGQAKAIVDTILGKDVITNEDLTTLERILNGVAGVASIATAKTLVQDIKATQAGSVVTQGTKNSLDVADTLLPDAEFAGRGVVRTDLTDHLVKPNVLKKQISGGHNSNNFIAALQNAGGKVTSKTEIAPGIFQLEYQLPGATKSYPKTVYDPMIYSDGKMAEMANLAANKALIQYQLTGSLSPKKVVINGIEFSVPLRIENGQPYVPTAYPIGVKK